MGEPRQKPSRETVQPREAAAAQPGEDGPPKEQSPDGALVPGGKVAAQPAVAAKSASNSGGGPPSPSPGLPPLMPSQQQVARAIGGGSDDHLQDIDDGDETSLNAKKWKFASFFNRVKQQVREHWKPGEVYRLAIPPDRSTAARIATRSCACS